MLHPHETDATASRGAKPSSAWPFSARPVVAPRQAGGFTYLELVLVLLCLAVAASLVLPEFAGGEVAKLQAAAQTLVSDLEYAQQQSMAHGDDCRMVVFNTANATYWIAPSSAPNNAIPHPVDRQPFVNRFGHGRYAHLKGVVIESCDLGGDNRLGFRSLGQLDQSGPATVTLRGGRYRIAVRLDPTTGEASVNWVK
jgi:type II secretory pathway pseudopilin PulG